MILTLFSWMHGNGYANVALAVCEGLFSRLSWLVPVSEALMLPVSAFRFGFTNGLMSESMILWFGVMLGRLCFLDSASFCDGRSA